MALILNIESTTTVCSVALAKDGKLIELMEINEGFSHAENLTFFIQEILKKHTISISSIDAVAVSKGPGSYTGLRIGVAAAKGICYAIDKPLIAIGTLKHLTQKVKREEDKKSQILNPKSQILFCPMLDARRMEVYCALYDNTLIEVEPVQAKIIDERSFENILNTKTILFFGNGAEKCKEILSQNKNAVFIDNIHPSAADMISFSEELFKQNKFEDLAYFEPYYLKEFVSGNFNP